MVRSVVIVVVALSCCGPAAASPPNGRPILPGPAPVASLAPPARPLSARADRARPGSRARLRACAASRRRRADLAAAPDVAPADGPGAAAAAAPDASRRRSLGSARPAARLEPLDEPRPLGPRLGPARADRVVDPAHRGRPLGAARTGCAAHGDRLRPRPLARGVPQPAEHDHAQQAALPRRRVRAARDRGLLRRRCAGERPRPGGRLPERSPAQLGRQPARDPDDRRRARGARRGHRARPGRRQHQLRRRDVLRFRAARDPDRLRARVADRRGLGQLPRDPEPARVPGQLLACAHRGRDRPDRRGDRLLERDAEARPGRAGPGHPGRRAALARARGLPRPERDELLDAARGRSRRRRLDEAA